MGTQFDIGTLPPQYGTLGTVLNAGLVNYGDTMMYNRYVIVKKFNNINHIIFLCERVGC